MKYLLDANVLVAIADTQHVHHDVATSWIEPAKRGTLFTCATVENALLRFLIRTGLLATDAHDVLTSLHRDARFTRVAETDSLQRSALVGVVGFRQITDVYLCQVAQQHQAQLATFDRGLSLLRSDQTLLLASTRVR